MKQKNLTAKDRSTECEKSPLPDELRWIIQRARHVLHERILRMPVLREKTGRAPPTIWKDIADGVFPTQVRIGTRAVGWRESEGNARIEACSFASRCNNQSFDMKAFIAELTDVRARGSAGRFNDPLG